MEGRILVVDDTPSNLRLLMNLLTQHSYVVHPATNGQAALRFLDITLPDLILLDAVMPGMDGYQVAERLKANERTREIPLIFISAANQPLDKVKAFGCGAVDYIVKPFQAEEVAARIATHLALRNLQRNLEQRVAERTAELQEANVRLNEEIVERRRVEEALREREARLRRLVESDIIGVCFWHHDRGITEANDAFLHLIGYGREDLRSGPIVWPTITPPEFQDLDQRAFAEARQKGSCTPYEKELLRKDGERIPVLVGAATFEGCGDEGVAFVLDLSERRRAETETQARLAAEVASRAKSAFLASMSHELRTPLSAILGYAQLLKRDPKLGEQQLAGLNTIQQSGEHLLTLINDILDLSRIEAGRIELHLETVDLQNFLRGVTDIVGVKAQLKGLCFEVNLAPGLPQTVRVDPQRLRQILLNLLSNAVKFTDRGRISLLVRSLPGSSEGTCLRFEVEDTGPGIDPAQQEIIFQPFEQVGEIGRRYGGSGLGLAISRQLVRQMGGDIRVDSRPGRGSRFWFELNVHLAMPAEAAPVPVERAVVGYRGPRRRVLVVEDIESNRVMLMDFMKQLGFEVDEAANGQEGLELILAAPPDLVVMDIMMPVLDGLEAMRRIRQHPDLERLPIITVSASAQVDDRSRSLEAGANAFIVKPIAPARLVEEIGTLLGLEWEYEETGGQGVGPRPETGELLAPPREEIEILHHLARTGSMRDICSRANHLAALDERYRPFADRLRELANSYQSKAILALVGKYMDGGQ